MIKLVIFDLDGTLCDTIGDIYAALSYSFASRGFEAPPLSQVKSFMGDGLKTFLEKNANYASVPFDEELEQTYLRYYAENCVRFTTPYPDIKKILETLQSKSVKLAVVSNKAAFLAEKILRELELSSFFEKISGGDSYPEKKPSPLPIIETIKFVDSSLSFTEVLMIGDSENDVAAGNNAGIKTCLCEYGYTGKMISEPDYRISAPSDILKRLF